MRGKGLRCAPLEMSNRLFLALAPGVTPSESTALPLPRRRRLSALSTEETLAVSSAASVLLTDVPSLGELQRQHWI